MSTKVLLSNGSITDYKSDLKDRVRAIQVGIHPVTEKNLFIAVDSSIAVTGYKFCRALIHPFFTREKFYNNIPSVIQDFDGKCKSTRILDRFIDCDYEASFIPALTYCNKFNNGIKGVATGDWYLPAAGELLLVYKNYNSIREVINDVLEPDLAYDYLNNSYMTCSQYSEADIWYMDIDANYIYDREINLIGNIIPFLQF